MANIKITDDRGKKGLETASGVVILQPEYDSIEDVADYGYDEFLTDPIYRLAKDGKFGLIEVSGFRRKEVEYILPIEYDEINKICEEDKLFIAKKDGKYALFVRRYGWLLPLDNDNMSVIEHPNYSEKKTLCNTESYLLVQKGDKYGILFIPRVHKVEFEFDCVLPPIDEYGIRVKKDGVWGYLDKNRNFTPNLNEVTMEWEALWDVRIDENTSVLHEVNRGKKKIKSEIDIPPIDLDIEF